MGNYLDEPKTEKLTARGEGNGIRYGVSAMQGWRIEMEDEHVCIVSLPYDEDTSFFGVFDGHDGPETAQDCAKNLHACISKCYKERSDQEDEVLRRTEAIHAGFLELDKQQMCKSGASAVVAILTQDKIFFGHCGNCRAFLCRDGKVFFPTVDHRPDNEEERSRIEKAGGTVEIGEKVARVHLANVESSLISSRGLGDFEFKGNLELSATEQVVSPEPEIKVIDRDHSSDQFLLLACKGVYHVMTNEEVCTYVHSQLSSEDNLEDICGSLIDTCLDRVSLMQ